MGPYKITMRLDFCGNRATSRGRVICCVRSLLLLHFFFTLLFLFFFFFLFIACRRIRASATISTDRRSYNKLRNNNFISPNKTPFVPVNAVLSSSSPYPHPPYMVYRALSAFKFSAISLLFQLFAPYLVFLLAFSDC